MAPTFDPPSSLMGIDTLVGEVEDVTPEALLVAIEDPADPTVELIVGVDCIGDILELVDDILELVVAIVVTNSVSGTAEDVVSIVEDVTVDEGAIDIVDIVVVF